MVVQDATWRAAWRASAVATAEPHGDAGCGGGREGVAVHLVASAGRSGIRRALLFCPRFSGRGEQGCASAAVVMEGTAAASIVVGSLSPGSQDAIHDGSMVLCAYDGQAAGDDLHLLLSLLLAWGG